MNEISASQIREAAKQLSAVNARPLCSNHTLIRSDAYGIPRLQCPNCYFTAWVHPSQLGEA